MPRGSSDVRQDWARLGAAARLQQLEEERRVILAAFPGLRGANVSGAVAKSAGRPRRTMSAKARKAMSAGMRKYWARRKAQEKA